MPTQPRPTSNFETVCLAWYWTFEACHNLQPFKYAVHATNDPASRGSLFPEPPRRPALFERSRRAPIGVG